VHDCAVCVHACVYECAYALLSPCMIAQCVCMHACMSVRMLCLTTPPCVCTCVCMALGIMAAEATVGIGQEVHAVGVHQLGFFFVFLCLLC